MPTYSASADAMALTAATAKSVMEIKTPSTTGVMIVKWWVEFDGVTATNPAVKVEVGRFSSAVTTNSAFTPALVDYGENGLASQCTVGTNASSEGAGTFSVGEVHRIPPTSGLVVQDPLGLYWQVGASGFWRIRLTAAQAVNATVGVTWSE